MSQSAGADCIWGRGESLLVLEASLVSEATTEKFLGLPFLVCSRLFWQAGGDEAGVVLPESVLQFLQSLQWRFENVVDRQEAIFPDSINSS